MARRAAGNAVAAAAEDPSRASLLLAYPEWPAGLGDPLLQAASDAFRASTASAKGRKELVAAFRARKTPVETTSSPVVATTKKLRARDFEGVKFPPRKCSFQTRCRRGLATKKCHNCVKFDELQLGYYCDACFDARHPAYRMEHSWVPVQDDVDEEQEWVAHVARLKLEQDGHELKLLLAETQTPPVPPPPPKPPNVQRTPRGTIDFHSTYVAMASVQGTLRRLIEQVHAELEWKAPLTRTEALVKIQRMWKIRSARKQLKALVRSVYASFEDPATGETYYYNTKTNTTQWSKPKALGTSDDIPPVHARTATILQERPTRVFSSRQEQENDAAVRIQGMLRAHSARAHMRKLISSVYEKIWDSSSARFYYHNTRTKHVKWAKPRWVSDADLLSPRTRQQRAEADERSAKLAVLRATITEGDAAVMLQRAYRRKRGFEALLQLCRQVYERIFDPHQNAYYYHNTRTEETTWEKPALLRNAKADVLSPRSRRQQLEAAAATTAALMSSSGSLRSQVWTEESAAACLQTLFRSRRARRALDARLAQVYRRVLDTDSGCFYFVDTRTDAVSWDAPTLLQRRSNVEHSVRSVCDFAPRLTQEAPNARMWTGAAVALATLALAAALGLGAPEPIDEPLLDLVTCGVDEIQLASDGMIDRRSLQLGERVTPNHTLRGAVQQGSYHFYHLCIVRHEHEHQIHLNLTVERPAAVGAGRQWRGPEPDANLYLSSEEPHPRVGHSSWIAQRVGSDFIRLYTYLDGFPRRADDARSGRSIPLHIGVRGVSAESVRYNLTVSVLDLPQSADVAAREQFYSQQHKRDRERFAGVAGQRTRRLRVGEE
ncbi:hypothetical protein PybrP1_003693 [[Pythium] brassicae (nom. inval.)]|nr:hypothetical protein PybrP1_003693 [[Pythium] brassicae (nom. inval.)]